MTLNQILKGALLIALGLIILFAVFMIILVTTVQSTAEKAFAPMNQAGDYLATQSSLIFNPTPTIIPDPVTIIHEIRSLARLETAQYSMEKIITAETGQSELKILFGDKLLFVGHGKVIAGIDLEKLRPDDLWIDSGVLFVRLPPAEIFLVALDNRLSYVYDRETGLLTRGEINLETLARQAAEEEIQKAALADGILTWATQNAESYMARLFRGLGYRDVVFMDS